MTCLGQCEETFSLSILQKVLRKNLFSKWLSRIQIAELEKADINGLEECPFCPFATILLDDSTYIDERFGSSLRFFNLVLTFTSTPTADLTRLLNPGPAIDVSPSLYPFITGVDKFMGTIGILDGDAALITTDPW